MTQLVDPHTASQFDRLPPHSTESEQCLLASMLLDKEAISNSVGIVTRDSFYQADHQIIFDVLMKLFADARPIDAIIVREELIKLQLLEEIGGDAYLAQLLDTVPSSAHAVHYAGIVREKFLLRQVIAASNEALRDAYAPHEKADEVVDRCEHRIFEISENKIIGGACTTMAETVMEAYADAESQTRRGIETGFLEVDDMLNGLQNGEMIVIASRPSMGKSAIAGNIVEHVAGNLKIPCAIFSLEMNKRSLAQRMMCSRAGVDAQKVRKGMLSADDYSRLADAANDLAKLPIYVDDCADLTVMGFRAKCRRVFRQGVRLIVVDYLQLMNAPEVEENRQQQVSKISRGIKSVARELNFPIVAISQLNRASEGREGHRPRMSDLRESGSLEQDADVVILLHREDYYKLTDPDFCPDNIAEIIVAKQRNGPTGTVKLTFDSKTTTFRNLAAQIDPMFA